MSRRTDDACILWMELDGEVYSPDMPLSRASLELICRDIWNGAYAGICRAVYRYGAPANGGSYCREVTQEVAARLGEMSFAASDAPRASVRTFLEAMGIAYDKGGAPQSVEAARPAFEMVSPPEPASRTRRASLRRKAKAPTPQELRAQPQLKLPIAGGKGGEASHDRLLVESDHDADLGVQAVSLKDPRPLAEQKASWDRFRVSVSSWRAQDDDGAIAQQGSGEHTPDRKSARGGG